AGLPYTFQERPFAIRVNERVATNSIFTTNLLTALQERGLLDQVVWEWWTLNLPSNRFEVQIGARVPTPIVQGVMRTLLTLTNAHFVVTAPDDDRTPWLDQEITVGGRPGPTAREVSPSRLRSLLASNVSEAEFRVGLLGGLGILQSPAHSNALAA